MIQLRDLKVMEVMVIGFLDSLKTSCSYSQWPIKKSYMGKWLASFLIRFEKASLWSWIASFDFRQRNLNLLSYSHQRRDRLHHRHHYHHRLISSFEWLPMLIAFVFQSKDRRFLTVLQWIRRWCPCRLHQIFLSDSSLLHLRLNDAQVRDRSCTTIHCSYFQQASTNTWSRTRRC